MEKLIARKAKQAESIAYLARIVDRAKPVSRDGNTHRGLAGPATNKYDIRSGPAVRLMLRPTVPSSRYGMDSNSNRHLAEERIIVIKPGKIDRALAQKFRKNDATRQPDDYSGEHLNRHKLRPTFEWLVPIKTKQEAVNGSTCGYT